MAASPSQPTHWLIYRAAGRDSIAPTLWSERRRHAWKRSALHARILAGIETGAGGLHAYFVHSFHLVPADRGALVAEADYGGPVTAMVGVDNIAGTQFHPEKSQTLGLRLISNFLKWRP